MCELALGLLALCKQSIWESPFGAHFLLIRGVLLLYVPHQNLDEPCVRELLWTVHVQAFVVGNFCQEAIDRLGVVVEGRRIPFAEVAHVVEEPVPAW